LRLSLRPRHVRNRLTLFYLAVLSSALALYVASTLVVLRISLARELDERLKAAFEQTEEAVDEAPGTLPEGDGVLVEALSSDGEVLLRSPALGSSGVGLPPGSPPGFSTLPRRGESPLRVLSRPHRLAGRRVTLRVALSEGALDREYYELAVPLLVGLPVALAIAGLCGNWLAGRALGPLDRMARHAERITAKNLSERLPVGNPDDELGHLARVFNACLERIEESFAQLRRFTADASHELRTPLTAIRSVGEVGLSADRSGKEYRDIIGSLLEEADRLALLVDSLLSLSRADAGELRLQKEPVDLVPLLSEVASHLEVLAEEKDQVLIVTGLGPVVVAADPVVLRQAFVNLVANAIKYSPEKARVEVTVGGRLACAVVDVTDEGPGIPLAERGRVFERFYRIDGGRSREGGGAGLGLAVARWAIRAHGGEIEILGAPGAGSTFRVTLPPEDKEALAPEP
jgi:heavy metal sensor kinase